jgi:hypothetical protein
MSLFCPDQPLDSAWHHSSSEASSLRSSHPASHRLEPVMAAELEEPGVPLQVGPWLEDKSLRVVEKYLLWHSLVVAEALFHGLEDGGLGLIQGCGDGACHFGILSIPR